jgi:hypothetical protein
MGDNAARQLAELLSALDRKQQTNKLKHYIPYPYQLAFHNAEGYKTRAPASQRALMAANQVGKTTCGAMEVAIHATGRYPVWWKGHRFTKPINVLVGGLTNESVRDICQKELCGEPTDDKQMGTGTIPLECIRNPKRKAGVPDALDSVQVSTSRADFPKLVLEPMSRARRSTWARVLIWVGWTKNRRKISGRSTSAGRYPPRAFCLSPSLLKKELRR